MKKGYVILVSFCVTIIVLWFIARITGMLQYYRVSTVSNEPTLKVGQSIFTTNLKTAKPYNFITFTSAYIDSVAALSLDNQRGAHFIQRLCAKPGDIVEMKNAVFFVNGQNFDEELNLNQQYKISKNESLLIDEQDISPENGDLFQLNDSVLINIDKILIKKYSSIKFKPYFLNDTTVALTFQPYANTSGWTVDNFGPLTIPANCYFVLGDNRHNALDSRYAGFIKKENIKGVVLSK